MANSTPTVRTRFAPSPTGFVHIGSLRTALFAFLFARHNNGNLILRVEDTDRNRLVEGSIENLLKVMNEVGIDFDEGPNFKNGKIVEQGNFGSYIQSKRKEQGIYEKYAKELVEQGSAYYCFCSEERLEEVRKEQTALKKPPMYDRHCRNLSPDEIAAQWELFKAAGKQPVVRQAIPMDGQTTIHDLIYGAITYDHKVLDDQVLLKSDGFPTYHLAVVVDDHFMEITHIIRGEEWIPSTPKHILLFKALGWTPPEFAHLPIILNPDKSKLSKRQGDVSVEDFLRKGYLKEALVNFVAFLGWNPKTEQEIFSMDELIAQFDLVKVNKAAPIFDLNKLDWLNGLYIRKMHSEELAKALLPFWQATGIKADKFKMDYLKVIADLERERLKKLSEIGERTKYFFEEPEYNAEILVWKKSTKDDAKEKLSLLQKFLEKLKDFSQENLELEIKEFISSNNFDTGSVLWPLRVALTGADKSPGPFEVAATLSLGLGKEEVIKRIETAIKKL